MNNKKEIKINFVSQIKSFEKNDNFIIDSLKKKYKIVISDTPDFLFCDTYWRNDIIKYDKNAVRVFYSCENCRPNFNLYDYIIGYDYLDFGDRYLRYPYWVQIYLKNQIDVESKKSFDITKRDFCSYVTSKKWSHSTRDDFYRSLSEYKKIDSGGKNLNNIGYIVEDKKEFLKRYKFNIAFENSSTIGYTTEKIVDAFAANTIPIYWGNREVTRDFNKNSFINCSDFDNFEEVIKYIMMLDNNDRMYQSMLKEECLTKEARKYLDSNYLDDFLYHIIDQGREKAIRRTVGFYYESIDEMNMEKLEKIKVPLSIIRKIKNTLMKE